jgi:amino acid transporter
MALPSAGTSLPAWAASTRIIWLRTGVRDSKARPYGEIGAVTALSTRAEGLVRGFGPLEAVALNMSNMVGAGPFITIPLIIASMGGPQCMLGWFLGAILALCDGLVWSELAAAMPGTGGTYLYLREAFRKTRLGGILPFLFIWQFIFSGPLEIASGYIGFSQYVSYFWRGMSPAQAHLVNLAVGTLVIALLYRRTSAVGRITVTLWVGVLVTMLWIIVSGLANFHARVAFDFPPNAFTFSTGFAAGLGSALLIAMYDFMGYYDICYTGGEVRNPVRTIPRSILYSVLAVAGIYSLLNLSIIGVVPWRQAMQSKFIASEFVEQLYGPKAAAVATALVLWTALASVFALLLGYSRILYAAAEDGHFFRIFARLHPTGKFPHVSLLAVGLLAIGASFWSLDAVISALLTSRILVQFIAQIFALDHLRKHRAEIVRPFRMWLYPVPSAIAFLGWAYIFLTSGWGFIGFGLLTLALGVATYAVWKRAFAG